MNKLAALILMVAAIICFVLCCANVSSARWDRTSFLAFGLALWACADLAVTW